MADETSLSQSDSQQLQRKYIERVLLLVGIVVGGILSGLTGLSFGVVGGLRGNGTDVITK